MVEGEATLVAGGTMVGAKRTSPDQMVATSIEGGEPYRLTKGDVITIPAKTPHWWKDIPTKTVAYYAVEHRKSITTTFPRAAAPGAWPPTAFSQRTTSDAEEDAGLNYLRTRVSLVYIARVPAGRSPTTDGWSTRLMMESTIDSTSQVRWDLSILYSGIEDPRPGFPL